jgi:hypothetical protein
VLIQLPNGQQQFIPLDWTDQATLRVSLPGACFLLEHLRTLRQRLEALSQKKGDSGTIPSQSNRKAEGDRNGTTGAVEVGPAFSGATRPDDRYFGTDDPATMEPAGRGEAQ